MKKEAGMSVWGRVVAKLVCILMLGLTVLQVALFVLAGGIGCYENSLEVILYTTIITLLIGVILLYVLAKTAGYTKGEAGLKVRWIDRIPVDIFVLGYSAVSFGLWCMGIVICEEISPVYMESWNRSVWSVVVFSVLVFGMMAAYLVLLLGETLAIRIRQGKFWKNSLVYRLLSWIVRLVRRGMDFCARSLPMIWKAVLIYIGIAFLEFVGILICYWETDNLLILWALEKIVIFAVLSVVLVQMQKLKESGKMLAAGNLSHKTDTDKMYMDFKEHGENLNQIGIGIQRAVEERMKSEHFKTELITNVSHDIKTPLTSIINYVDLLEKEELKNEKAKDYLEVLHRQSARLKKLIEDLMEASKASTGALTVNYEDCEVGVMLTQAAGEFEERLAQKELELIISKPEEDIVVQADGRHLWRIFDNLLNNIYKYAQPGTRVYLNLEKKESCVNIIFRNTSRYALNISGEELQERFVRGDSSRHTEGSGLGLSIARSLTELMGGKFELVIDGDLFKVILTW